MPGIGDSWGTKDELLHPRGPDGRWIRKAGMAKSLIQGVLDFLANFRPRMFQNKRQSNQYLTNIASRQGRGRMGRADHIRLRDDLGATNADLRDGVIDEPSTQRFVQMMDRSATELPDDVILTRVVGVDSFGYTPQTAAGTSSDADPGIREMSGKLIADRGYSLTTIGGVEGTQPAGSVRMVIAAKKGTKVVIPAAGPEDSTIFLDRDQPLRVTKVEPDGVGGWTMFVTADSSGRHKTPEPIAGPIGEGRRPSKEREASIRESGQRLGKFEKRPDDEKEAADEQARAEAAAKAAETPVTPSPMQEAERRRVEQLQQQAGVQPRTEPIHAPSIGGEPRPATGPGGAPETQAPGAPEAPTAPRRTVDLRLAVRDAGIPAPAAGPNRKRFNDAYEGVISGKKDPIDAARELDRDATDLEAAGDADADNLRQLSDVIKREYGLEQPAAKKAPGKAVPRTEAGLPKVAKSQMQELDERKKAAKAGKATAPEAAPTPTPVKAAKKSGLSREQEDRVIARAQQFRGNERNEEEQRIVGTADEILARRRGETPKAPAPVAKKAPAKMAAPVVPPAELTPEQEIKGLFNGKRPTNAQLREMGERNNLGFGPKEPRSEMILAILGARPSRGRQRGEVPVEAPKKAAPEAPGDDLDRMTKQQMLDELERRGVETRKSWDKEKLKRLLRDEDAAGNKRGESQHTEGEAVAPLEQGARPGAKVVELTPEVREQRRREAEKLQRQQEAELAGPDLDRMTKQELIAEAGRRGVTAPQSWTKDKIKAAIRGREEAGAGAPEAPAPVKKAAKAAVPKRMTIGEARRLSAVEAIRANEPDEGQSNSWKTILSRVDGGDWTVARARKEAKDSARYWREQAATVRRGGGRSKPEKVEEAASRLERAADTYDKLAEDLTISQSVTKTDKFMGAPSAPTPAKKAAKAAPDSVQQARARQTEIFETKRFADTASELEQLIQDDASDKAILARFDAAVKREGVEGTALDMVRGHLEAGRRDEARAEMRRILDANGITPTATAGDIIPFDPKRHQRIAGAEINEGDMVQVVRPGHRGRIRGEDVDLNPSVVERVTPEEARKAESGARRVPEGSVKGDRPQAPIDNEPRKREFGDAWDSADLEAEGAAGRSLKEIRDDVASGKITPEEGIRRIEGEIAFNQEDLNEVDANLRQPDLSPEQRTRLQSDAAKLQGAIDAQKKASKFMRMYFSDEKPTIAEVRVNLDAEGFEALQKATPDDLREAARMQGLDPPKGNTKEEMLQDLVRQVAGKVARERGLIPKKAAPRKGFKAAKKAAPPKVSPDREKLDVRTIGAGIDFNENDKWTKDTLDGVQARLDAGDETPASIGRRLDDSATSRMTSAVYEHGQWHGDSALKTPEENAQARDEHKVEYDRIKAEVTKIRELAERLKKTRRRPVKKAASPEVKAAETRADTAEARLINERLDQLSKARSREQGDAALDGLTLPELRRVGEQVGGIKGRSKQDLKDKILERVKPELPPAQGLPATERLTPRQIMDRWEAEWENPMSRIEAAGLLEQLKKSELMEIAKEFKLPGASSMNMETLRRELVQAGVGSRLDSIATRGFRGARPGEGGLSRPTDALPLARRARSADITEPGEYFSDVQSAVDRADRRLRSGDSPTDVARELRERAAQVAKADLNEEGRRFKIEHDRDSLRSIRKSNAEYLRRVATLIQQEDKKSTSAKKAAPSAPEAPAAPTIQAQRAARLKVIEGGGAGRGPGTGPRPALKVVPPAKAAGKPDGPPLAQRIKRDVTDSNGRIRPRERPKADEPIHLPNGGNDQGRVHLDSELGELWQALYTDDREPNSFVNEVARIGEQVGTGELPLDQALQRLARMKGRATDKAVEARIQQAIDAMDAPKVTVPDLPDTIPAKIREALRKLAEIPTARSTKVRGIGRGEGSVFDQKLDIIRRIEAGDEERRLDVMLRERTLHESVDGALEMWRLFEGIDLRELAQWRREAYRRAHPQLTP